MNPFSDIVTLGKASEETKGLHGGTFDPSTQSTVSQP